MMYQLVPNFWGKVTLFAILATVTLIIPASAVAKNLQTWSIYDLQNNNDATPPHMEYQPPRDADRIEQFVPPGVEITRLEVENGRSSQAPLDIQRGDVFSFYDDKLAAIMEGDTFENESFIRFTGLREPGYQLPTLSSAGAVTETNELNYPDQQVELMRFQMDIEDAPSRTNIDRFSKPTRIMVDLRPYIANLDSNYTDYYLAYQDEENPSVWHDVSVIIHQTDGLISAEVIHFKTGWLVLGQKNGPLHGPHQTFPNLVVQQPIVTLSKPRLGAMVYNPISAYLIQAVLLMDRFKTLTLDLLVRAGQ